MIDRTYKTGNQLDSIKKEIISWLMYLTIIFIHLLKENFH